MGINPIDTVKMFMQGAQKQNPNLDPAATAKTCLVTPTFRLLLRHWKSCTSQGESTGLLMKCLRGWCDEFIF